MKIILKLGYLTSAAKSTSQSILDEFMCKGEDIKIINKTIYKHVKKLLADTQRQAHETSHIDSDILSSRPMSTGVI